MEHKNTWITIPTYWGDYGTPDNPPCIDFDHPTALNGEETLSRTLESICRLPGDFRLLIILAVTHPEYLTEAAHKVQQIIAHFHNLKRVFLATPEAAAEINRHLDDPILRMDSYGNIRNVQLFVPYCLGADYVIGIDDDEIIEDPKYLEKVLKAFSDHSAAGGLAGPYFDREGEFRLKGAEALGKIDNIFLKKNFYMNEALKTAMARFSEVHRSVIAFGGNMVFTRKTISSVCHDPYIPRGEDYDYVINALMCGIYFFYHPEMGIVHLPPDSTGSQAGDNIRKLKADIRRFLYMKIKIEEHRKRFPEEAFSLKLLDPYPGAFLIDRDELVRQAKAALPEGYPEIIDRSTAEAFVEQAMEAASRKCGEFFEYRERWRRILSICGEDPNLSAIVNRLCST